MLMKKELQNVSGKIQYSYKPNQIIILENGLTIEDLDKMSFIDTFSSLEEFLQKLQPQTLEEIKQRHHANEVWISSVSFIGKNENDQTSSKITLTEEQNQGSIMLEMDKTKINAIMTLQKIKKKINDKLDEMAIKF